MSVTQRQFPLTVGMNLEGLKTYPIAYGSVSGDRTTITLIQFYQESGHWLNGYTLADFPRATIINGIQYIWTINETVIDGIYDQQTYVKRATLNIGTRLTIDKPFFPLKWGANNEFEYMFSFYDLGSLSIGAYTSLAGQMFELDGKTPLNVELDEQLGSFVSIDLTPDATYRFTFTFGTKTYQTTRKTSANQTQLIVSYAPPASWCEEAPYLLNMSMSIKIEAVFGTQVYQSIPDQTLMHIPDDFVPVIGNIQIADTMKRVPAAWGMFVQDNSNIAIQSLQLTPAYGSPISTVDMTVLGKTYAGTPSYLPKTLIITEYGVMDVTVKVKDGRGRTAEKTARVTFVEYKPPTLQADSPRCDENGDTSSGDGVYFLAQTVTTYSPCNGKNTLSLTMRYKITSDKYYTMQPKTLPTGASETVCGGDCDPEFSYDVEYVLKDGLNTITVIDYVSTGLYCIHFLHGGRGVAFGAMATRENFADFSFAAIFRDETIFTKDSGEEVTAQEIIEKLETQEADIKQIKTKLDI